MSVSASDLPRLGMLRELRVVQGFDSRKKERKIEEGKAQKVGRPAAILMRSDNL